MAVRSRSLINTGTTLPSAVPPATAFGGGQCTYSAVHADAEGGVAVDGGDVDSLAAGDGTLRSRVEVSAIRLSSWILASGRSGPRPGGGPRSRTEDADGEAKVR